MAALPRRWQQPYLDGIKHETLRKNYDEPRLHMMVNCASRGRPVLRQEPYRGADLDAQPARIRFNACWLTLAISLPADGASLLRDGNLSVSFLDWGWSLK